MLKISENSVFIEVNNKTYNFVIHCASFYDWFCANKDGKNNDCLFCDCGYKNRTKLANLLFDLLGYMPDMQGRWPICRHREDVVKILQFFDGTNKSCFIDLTFHV